MFAEQPPGLGSLWYGTAPVSGCSQSALHAGGWSWALSLEQSHEDVQQCGPTGPESVSTTVLGRCMRRGGKALPENNFHSNDGNAVTQVKGIDLRHETPLARIQATGCFPRNLLSPSTQPSCPSCSRLPGFLLGKGRRAALPFSPSAPIKTVQQPQSPTRESFDSRN